MSMRYGSGIGLGSILAVILSWSRNHDLLWAIIDFILGWIYVIYWFLTQYHFLSIRLN